MHTRPSQRAAGTAPAGRAPPARRPPPRHIGIVLDGNRRYGRSQGISDPQDLYELGAHKLDEVLDWCAEFAIPAVTLWVLSADNLRRAQTEVSGILAALEGKLLSLARDPQIHSRRVRVRAIGRLELLPASVLAAVNAAREATASHGGMSLTIAAAYDGREEIVDAVRTTKQFLTFVASGPFQYAVAEALAGTAWVAGLARVFPDGGGVRASARPPSFPRHVRPRLRQGLPLRRKLPLRRAVAR